MVEAQKGELLKQRARTRRGPVLASAFSNRGTDNLAEVLHKLGVRVLRHGALDLATQRQDGSVSTGPALLAWTSLRCLQL